MTDSNSLNAIREMTNLYENRLSKFITTLDLNKKSELASTMATISTNLNETCEKANLYQGPIESVLSEVSIASILNEKSESIHATEFDSTSQNETLQQTNLNDYPIESLVVDVNRSSIVNENSELIIEELNRKISNECNMNMTGYSSNYKSNNISSANQVARSEVSISKGDSMFDKEKIISKEKRKIQNDICSGEDTSFFYKTRKQLYQDEAKHTVNNVSNNSNNLINDLSRKKSGEYNENVNNDLSQYLSNGFQKKKEELSETDEIFVSEMSTSYVDEGSSKNNFRSVDNVTKDGRKHFLSRLSAMYGKISRVIDSTISIENSDLFKDIDEKLSDEDANGENIIDGLSNYLSNHFPLIN